MTIRLTIALLIAACASSAASAACWGGGSYTQDLEGVYSQSWWVEHVNANGDGSCSARVRGDGKIGDFGGDLTIRCGYSPSWSWGAIYQDYPDRQAVPHAALIALSASVCSGN